MYRWAEHDISGEEQERKGSGGEGDQQADTQADKGIVSRICTFAHMYICTDGRNTTQPVKDKRGKGGANGQTHKQTRVLLRSSVHIPVNTHHYTTSTRGSFM